MNLLQEISFYYNATNSPEVFPEELRSSLMDNVEITSLIKFAIIMLATIL